MLLTIFLNSCIETPNQYEKLPPGNWRGILKLSDSEMISDEAEDLGLIETDKKLIDYFELPFNFIVEYDQNEEMKVFLINGEEKIEIDEIKYGRDPATAKDTVQFNFSEFDSYFDAFYEDNIIEGYWKVPYRANNYQIPFIAFYGENHRFDMSTSSNNYDFSGKWKVEFSSGSDDAYPAIGEFVQDDDKITGTFMTETGDYRYLQGNVSGEKMKLSVFDGAHAFLISCKVNNDTIIGEFKSGSHYTTNWTAVRDDNFNLTNPYDLTESLNSDPINFSFENLEGDTVQLSDEAFNDKIKLINIMGTWCPNCKDEIKFLKNLANENQDISIISIAFEKYKEKEKAIDVLKKYKNKMEITWPLLYGGYANKSETTKSFDFLDKIYSYPTLIIVDKNNTVVDIQTGFYGPATSEYDNFKKEFYSKLDQLRK